MTVVWWAEPTGQTVCPSRIQGNVVDLRPLNTPTSIPSNSSFRTGTKASGIAYNTEYNTCTIQQRMSSL